MQQEMGPQYLDRELRGIKGQINMHAEKLIIGQEAAGPHGDLLVCGCLGGACRK